MTSDESSHETISAIIQNYTGPKYKDWTRSADYLWGYEQAWVEAYCLDKHAPVLNVGCGAGRESFGFAKLCFSDVTGLDCTPALLDVARQRARDKGLTIRFDEGIAQRMPYPDGSFGVVTMFENVYGHITPRAERIRSLREVLRVLRPGGMFLMEVSSRNENRLVRLYLAMLACLHRIYNPCHLEDGDKKMRDARQTSGVAKRNWPRSHWSTPEDVAQESREAGLQIETITTQAGVLVAPKATAKTFRNQGRLLCVLRKAPVGG